MMIRVITMMTSNFMITFLKTRFYVDKQYLLQQRCDKVLYCTLVDRGFHKCTVLIM